MKVTGIIRRIDDLGRIVIPKEIRKTLRIKNGDNLEVFIDEEKIVLKKYSLVKNISDFAQMFTDSIYSFIKKNIIITDNDTVLAISGPLKKEYFKKDISEEMSDMLKRRSEMLENHIKTIEIIEGGKIDATYAMSPILVNGDVIGMVLIVSEDEKIGENEFKITQIAANFFKNNLEM